MNQALPQVLINQAVDLIVQQLAQDLVNDQTVSVDAFGTLSPYLRHSHLAHDLSTGLVRQLPAKRSVQLHPSSVFTQLILSHHERFRKKKKKRHADEEKSLTKTPR